MIEGRMVDQEQSKAMEQGEDYRSQPTTCLQDKKLARRRGRSPRMLGLQGRLPREKANANPVLSSVFTTLHPITYFSLAAGPRLDRNMSQNTEDQQRTVAGVSASLVSQERLPREGRMADQNAFSGSEESGSDDRGVRYGRRREKNVINPNIIIEILVHVLCNGREENPVKRSRLFQAICQCIKKIHPNFFCLLSDSGKPYENFPNFLQMFENIIDLTKNQICVGDQPAFNPSLGLDLVRAHQLVLPDSLGGDDRFSKEFKVHSILGSGGFGVVLKAENILDMSLYAVKIIMLRSHQKTDFSRVIREVQSLAKLQHRGIVKYNSTWMQPYNFHNLPEWTSSEGIDDDYEDMSSSLSLSSFGSQSASPQKYQSSVSSHRLPVITEIYGGSTMSSEDIVFKDSNPSHVNDLRRHMKYIELKDNYGDKESSKSFKQGQELVHQNCSELIHRSHNTMLNGIVTSNQCLFIQMELCGDSLDKWIRSRNEMCENGNQFSVIDLRRNKTIFLELFEAVRYMHSKNVIHRDLKPANIMFDLENKHIKLGDFGLSRHSIETAQNMGTYSYLTPINEYQPQTTGVGTKVYIAPEQLLGTSYDTKSDMYSLGIITLELCQPFSTESEKYFYISALKQRKPLKKMEPHFIHPYLQENSPLVVSLITQLTEYLPKNRPSAEDVLGLLKELPDNIEETTHYAPHCGDCSPGSKPEDSFRKGVSNAEDANSIKETDFAQDGNKRQNSQFAHNANRSTQYSLTYSALYYAQLEQIKALQNENTILKEKNNSLEEEKSKMFQEIEILKHELSLVQSQGK